MVRLFTAVKIPERLTPVIAELEDELPSAHLKLVRANIAHITLKFMGEVPEGDVLKVREVLRGVHVHGFKAALRGMGAFPSVRRARVVWVGCEGEFAPLFEAVEDALLPLGFEREKRRFHAHLTLARIKHLTREEVAAIEGIIKRHTCTTFGTFDVNEFVLFQSTLTPAGPIYRELESFPLEG
ncbi:MAG: RNA 2',3'-cyclic phosphodiesterase [Methermicoccaceae archaeon]